jgi:ubiquinone/menaquinone biosynthesis C-methylase UbiE
MTDYITVTEAPGIRITRESLAMLHARYALAERFCEGRDVLEVGCGAGMGLGYLAQRARSVVGADCSEPLLAEAKKHYRERIPLVRLDAHLLPFRASAFDAIIFFEAIYYLTDAEKFLDECCRVLRPNGFILICSANREWSAFNPSPHSHQYFSAAELRKLLKNHHMRAEIFVGFPVAPTNYLSGLTAGFRKVAVRFRLIPKTMRGKELLKRIFYGRLTKLEAELMVGRESLQEFVPLASEQDARRYRIIYAVGQVSNDPSSRDTAQRVPR